MARELEVESRISARSLPELRDALEQAFDRAKVGKRFVWRGKQRRLQKEPFLNAIVLDWIRKPADEQDAHLAMRLAELDRMMASDEPVALESLAAPSAASPRAAVPDVVVVAKRSSTGRAKRKAL